MRKTTTTFLILLIATACAPAFAQSIEQDIAGVQEAYRKNAGSRAWFTTNVDKRSEAWRESAASGEPGGMWLVGWCHLEGYGEFEGDSEKAFELTKAAAEKGHALAQNGLGYLYQQGNGVEQDSELAVQWYEKAAAQGVSMACWNLAEMYGNGDGVEEDEAVSRKWHEKAASLGQFDSIRQLISNYEYGIGVEADPDKVEELYNQLGDAGDPKGTAHLVLRFENVIDDVPKDQAKADKYRAKLEQQVGKHSADYLRLVSVLESPRQKKMPRLQGIRDGKTFRFQDEVGKVVALRFGASWCGYCRSQNSTFEEIAEKHDDFVLVDVDIDENPHLQSLWEVSRVPRVYLIDRQGVVQDIYGSRVKSLPEAVDNLIEKNKSE